MARGRASDDDKRAPARGDGPVVHREPMKTTLGDVVASEHPDEIPELKKAGATMPLGEPLSAEEARAQERERAQERDRAASATASTSTSTSTSASASGDAGAARRSGIFGAVRAAVGELQRGAREVRDDVRRARHDAEEAVRRAARCLTPPRLLRRRR